MFYPDRQKEKRCFLAAGSGITPCYSLIRTLLGAPQAKIILLYSNRSEKDTIFYHALKQLQENNKDRLNIHFMFSNRLEVPERQLRRQISSYYGAL
ncbi:hypothetical protein A8C56_12975 [Niabella ginsenosidivorans]|uniref:Oxidoreductase FAD/NAD(P)-binding domain-containing protein n=1 Tax=Niabella ginsenosidivorans TaxID=1176587 RepID=A0A1A9I5E1_9BACT|nr:hypothetical protein [Niabella ginsenosidivorans]ANH81774.1 hypothetical protein A8C56_12975 [Niabella ginsenosidivorans]